MQFTTLPRGAVEVLADGWYKWRGFKKQAWDFEEGWQLLNEAWQEQQQMHAAVSRRARRRKERASRVALQDTLKRPGAIVMLKHPRYKQTFQGRLQEEGCKATFVEEGSWISVTVEVPVRLKETARAASSWRDAQLYNALRGEHAKANRQAAVAARKTATADQLPKVPGDLEVKGRRGTGHLLYAWNGVEVAATPREHRPALPEHASAWLRASARETTHDRALRKLTRRVKMVLRKAALGKPQAIVVRAERVDAPVVGAMTGEGWQHPAISQLDDPVLLGKVRAVYEYLGSIRLHYCSTCDEEPNWHRAS